MANIVTGNYNTETLKTPKVQDYGSIYAAIGNALNQKYYQNRQAYINNIANPLSKIKASNRGKSVLEAERSKLIEGAEKFREEDNWFAADDYIFNTTESILNNEGLKAVQNDYALEQQYIEDLKKSDWDTQSQNAFLLRSRLQSKDIVYDPDTNTVTGGFNGIQIGKKFDVQKYQNDIFNILSKAKADKVSYENLVTNPDAIRQYGLDIATGYDGEKLASHFIKTGGSKEGITEDQIMSYAMSLLKSNPDYINYLTTVWQNQDALNRFVKDDSSAGGHLRNYELSDFSSLFSANPTMFALSGLGININELGAPTKEGKFVLNKNLSDSTKNAIRDIEQKYGINIIDILQNKAYLSEDIISLGLNNYLDNMFSSYATGVLGVTGNESDIDKNAWIQNILANQYINNNIKQLSSTAAGLLSYQDISSTIDLIANPAYTAYIKARAKGKEEELQTLQQYAPYTAPLAGFEVTSDSVKENLSRTNEITDAMTRLENSMNKIFTNDELGVLEINPGENDLLNSLNYNTAESLIDNSNLDDNAKLSLKSKLLEFQTSQRQYNILKSQRNSNEIQLNSVFDTWNKYRDQLTGLLGWYKVADPQAKLILDNRLSSYEDYINFINNGYVRGENGKFPITPEGSRYYKSGDETIALNPNYQILSEEEFNEVLSNAADNVSNRYRKSIADKPLEFTAVRDIVANPSPYQRQYMEQSIVNWKKGAGNISVVQTPSGKGIGMTGIELAKYIDFDAMPVSTTTNRNGVSVTRQSNPTKNSHPIPGKELGLDYDIYYTSIAPISNGIAAKQGKQEYAITLYDESGAARGNIIISEQLDPSTIGRQILDNYRNVKPYATIGGELLSRSAGSIESQYVNGFMDFDTTGSPNSPYVDNIATLQQMVDELGSVEYKLNIKEPINNSIDGNSRRIKIGKSTQGYYIQDLEGMTYPDGTTHYGEFAYQGIPGSLDVIEGITPSGIKYYNTVQEALAPIAEYILTQNGRMLDAYEAIEKARMQQIKNNYKSY